METGQLEPNAFAKEDMLFEKARSMKTVNRQVRECMRCEGLNLTRITEGCPGWGNLNAGVMFVGQSLHNLGMVSELPFIKGSGRMVDAALRLSGLERGDCYWTNVVHCHPERNRASTEKEKENCLPFLLKEICIVCPKILIALGNDAKGAMHDMVFPNIQGAKQMKLLFVVHPASLVYSAPEARPDWIVKLSLEIDRVIQ